MQPPEPPFSRLQRDVGEQFLGEMDDVRADVHLPVIEASARYQRPARYDDLLEIRTRVLAYSGARVSFEYEIRCDGDDAPLATGMTQHASVDGRGRPRRLPSELRSLLQ